MSNSKVILSGWLSVQDVNSIRSWKRRWCVHADYGLFLYRDASEQQSVGSILLPSYSIRPCDASDPVNKRFAFKAEHANLRTQYFIAESKEKMDEWVKVLNQSAQMLNSEPALDNISSLQRPASPDNGHDYYVLARDPNQNGEMRYQRQTYSQEESLPEYYPSDRQSAVSFQDYAPYSNLPNSEYSQRNSYSSHHMSPSSQHNNSFGEAPHSRSSFSSISSPYNQRHEYGYKSAKPQERNSDSSPGPPYHRQSISPSVGPYAEVAPGFNAVSYSSLDFNAMYHNGQSEDRPSPHGSYQSIGSPQPLDDTTVPKSIEAGIYNVSRPHSQNANSRHSLSSPQSPDFGHRNFSPSGRGPNRDSYSSRGDLNHSKLSYEIYPRNDNHSRDSLNFDVSQDSFAMNNSDVAAPYSKRLYGGQTDLSKLAVDSDHGDQKSVDNESHHEYATICRKRSESMCTSPEMMRSRPGSISVSQHGSDTDVPKRTSIQRLQDMHLRELQRSSPLSKSFSSGNVPNYHNISQTLSQNPDNDEDLEVAQTYMESENQNGNRTFSPESDPQNQIVYDYHGTGHDSTLPTRSSQGLSVKPQKYPSNIDISSNGQPHNNYVNVDDRRSYLDLVDNPESEVFLSAETSHNLHMDYRGQSLPFERNGNHMPNDSNLDANKPTDYNNTMEQNTYNHSRPSSELSDPYINHQTVSSNLQSAPGSPHERHGYQNGVHERNINTVKEDPNMPDTAVIETTHPMFAKLKASQGRLRMSISAGDLLGKTHEELVLLLIQLRRNKAHLERCRESLRNQIDQLRPFEQEYKRQLRETNTILDYHLEDKHGHFMELKKQCSEVENKLEMYKPIENLVDNMVTMGSLYGGNNYMLATQYRKHILHPDEYIPPKKMLEFSRQHQEDVIIQKIEKDVRELTNDEADLEEKMDRLCVLDRLIQEQSFNVTSLREDKEALEKTLRDIQYEQNRPADRSQQHLDHLDKQQHTVEKELSKAMLQLAEASKKLEELNAESSKLEHEIALLRTKVHGELNRSRSVPSLMGDQNHTRHKMEKDLHRVKDVMDNLSKEGSRLSQALHTLKHPPETTDESSPSKTKSSTYMETDLDSKESYDLASENRPPMFSPQGSSTLGHHEGQVGFVKYVRPSSRPTSPGRSQVDPNNTAASSSSPLLLESRAEQPLQSQLPAHFKAVGQEIGVAMTVTPNMDGDVSYDEENMWDIGDADDNTKRFYGLLPKERPRAQTVRDVKRQAGQRRERVGVNDKFRGRLSDENENKEPQPGISVPKLKRSPRNRSRYLTISSSEPIKLEHALQRKASINSSAGDLIPGATLINNMPDIVRSSTIDKFDEDTIDRELMKPEKVFIPERYMPDSDEEDVTEEEKEKRRAKAEKIRKVLTEQSIHSWTQQIPGGHPEQIHDHVAKEKIVREHLLTVTQELAKEVTKKSKEAAGQYPSAVKIGKASRITKGVTFSNVDDKSANSKSTKSSTSQKANTTATTNTSNSKSDPSKKTHSSKINSKLNLSVFQLLLADLVSDSSCLMEFLGKNSCIPKDEDKDTDTDKQKISIEPSDSKSSFKNFPNFSTYQSKIKAASLRILKNPPCFETEISYSKFKKHPLFHLSKRSDESEGVKESVWNYLESLLKDEPESSVKEETLNPVEIIPSLDALNLEPGSSVHKRLKPPIITFSSTPNLTEENSSLPNWVTVQPQEPIPHELHQHSPSEEPEDPPSQDPLSQTSHSIQKMQTLDVPVNWLFKEDPEDLEDLEVFYRLAEEIHKLNPTNV